MMAEPGCCQGCVPANPLAVVEILADQPLKLGNGPLRLSGTWQVSSDPDGWRYQLRGAEVKPGVTRRALMAASPLFCLPVPAMAQADRRHGGRHPQSRRQPDPRRASAAARSAPVAEPMRQGGLSAICLAVVADSPIIKLTERPPAAEPRSAARRALRLQPARLRASSTRWRASRGCRSSGRPRSSRAARASRPSVIVVVGRRATSSRAGSSASTRPTSAGQLRQLQLTHYRPNELGDIQTEPSVHGGLTAFGAEVIRRCNSMGIVVDVAHGTFDLVKAAARPRPSRWCCRTPRSATGRRPGRG